MQRWIIIVLRVFKLWLNIIRFFEAFSFFLFYKEEFQKLHEYNKKTQCREVHCGRPPFSHCPFSFPAGHQRNKRRQQPQVKMSLCLPVFLSVCVCLCVRPWWPPTESSGTQRKAAPGGSGDPQVGHITNHVCVSAAHGSITQRRPHAATDPPPSPPPPFSQTAIVPR